MKGVLLAVFASSALLLQGCVSYPVRFNGYAAPGTPASGLFSGKSFYVLEEKKPQNPLLSAEIRNKIDRMLRERGYRLADCAVADFLLDFSYSIHPGVVYGVRPETQPSETGTINTFNEDGSIRRSYITFPGYTTYVPYRYTAHTAMLQLQALDAAAMRDKSRRRVLWLGECSLTSRNSDLRVVIDYLLVAAFSHFGEDTRRSITAALSPKDPRIRELCPITLGRYFNAEAFCSATPSRLISSMQSE